MIKRDPAIGQKKIGAYQPSPSDYRNYRPGIPYTIGSAMEMKVREMTDVVLIAKQQEYLLALSEMEQKTKEHEIAYHKWILLRCEGEKRKLWGFIPHKKDFINEKKEL